MLPPCPARFTTRKAAILELLGRPDDDYTDASPKGAIDEGIRPLINEINKLDGFVTTSSCAGRVAVFLEGRKGAALPMDERTAPATTAPASTIASAGGKGGGGKWLFVSHDPLVNGVAADSTSPPQHSNYSGTDWANVFGLEINEAALRVDENTVQDDVEQDEERLVHFKFEPMILHVLTASLEHAQLLLRCASAAGFRESGAVSIVPQPLPLAGKSTVGAGEDEDDNPSMPIVAVRSMGLALASVIGICRSGKAPHEESESAHCIVPPNYLARLARVADERFAVNRTRTERFQVALVEAIQKEEREELASRTGTAVLKKRVENWEDAETRRLRKKEEGLRRQAALKEQQAESAQTDGQTDGTEDSLGGGLYDSTVLT
ncbi:hypothetical protein HMPREF1624_05176 [Sporothrix schenckii ATCC 58251]|uniref:tRNA(Phe) 7-[(3-amino-3-carboxypropyl)-4-demethylwyosine(37)-N(4)]-methyltransferase n=1 Tax=Sporothrix schenckii (strain ATCC 58251 / de Perez 2211183) TaxID=1391915 RepID=U7PS44_SPOS1|nr:hypothetical protein HMPREF1624_05176 [Sporothrix schenckii ATCC 58251]